MIKYKYAKCSESSLVDINDIKRESRYELAPYTCFGCGGELVPNLGKIKVKHFSHKTSEACSRETYLHNLAKNAFLEKYTQCLDERKPFILNSTFPVTCNKFIKEIGQPCITSRIVGVDLTKYFKMISLEKGFDGFVPDITLQSDDKLQSMFIEMAVTHKCDDNKINSGNRIIEINIEHEDDIKKILSGEISESSENIITYNFKKKNIIDDDCKGECETEASLFVVFESQKCVLLEMKLVDAVVYPIRGKVSHSEIIVYMSGHRTSAQKLFIHKVREAHFNKIRIKNCFLCRYHGMHGENKAIFCKHLKKSFNSNEAISCNYYRVFRTIRECEVADKSNNEYYNQPQFLKKQLYKAFSRSYLDSK